MASVRQARLGPWRFVLCAALGTASACSADDLGQVFPELYGCASVDDNECRSPLAIGSFLVAEETGTQIVLRNRGTGIFRIDAVQTTGGSGVTVGQAPEAVAAHSTVLLPLTINPVRGSNRVGLTVVSGDTNVPNLELDVRFSGVAPQLEVCRADGPSETPVDCGTDLVVDTGVVRQTQAHDVVVLVRNTGDATLHLADALVTNGQSVVGELTVLTSTSAGEIPAGTDGRLVIRYQPDDPIAESMTVTLTATDAAVPDPVTVTVNGQVPPNQDPTAVAFEVTTSATTVATEVGVGWWFDGRNSSDPEGDPLTYFWSIVSGPVTSSAVPDPVDAKLTRFLPDVLGSYILQLLVTDSIGGTGFADIQIDVEPLYFLTVEASWGTNAGDIDLHLVPSGDPLFGATDCFFCQPTVDWLGDSNALNDPVLLADDESGNGTERIAIRRPAAQSYDILVNYFDSLGGRTAVVTVEVARDDGSVSLGIETATLTADCATWKVGTIDWASSTFTTSTDPATTQCFPAGVQCN